MIDELPPAPDPATDSPSEFSAKAAASVLAQRALPGQINAAIAELNTLAAGGAYAFPYIFDTATADADPGAGKLRLNSVAQGSATVLRIDVLTLGDVNINGLFDALQGGTSSIKGSVRIVRFADPTKWVLFDIFSIGAGTGYRNMSLVPRASSSPAPFLNGDRLVVFFDRNGDSGTVPGSTELLGVIPVTSSVASINALSIFDADHDTYFAVLDGLVTQGATNLCVRLASGGVVNTSNYAYNSNGSTSSATIDRVPLGPESVNGLESSGILWFFGTGKGSNVGINYDGSRSGGAYVGDSTRANWRGSGGVSGFSIFPRPGGGGGLITAGTVRIYGIRKA